MTEEGRRSKRVAERIRATLAVQLTRDLADPSLAGLVITDVSVPDDLAVARVSVRLLVGDSPSARRRVVDHLQRACGRLRRAIGPELGLRRMPELRFLYDDGIDATKHVESILAEIKRESGTR